MTAIQQARQSLYVVEKILSEGEIDLNDTGAFFEHFTHFETLEMDRSVSSEKRELLKKINTVCYEHLRSRFHFSCLGFINRFVGPSYYKQLEARIRQELSEDAALESARAAVDLFIGLSELHILSRFHRDGKNS